MKFILQLNSIVVLLLSLIYSSCSERNNGPNTDSKSPVSQRNAGVDSSLFYKGEAIFKIDCNNCHAGKNRLHNYLEGVVQRVGANYLKLYLTRQDSLVIAKDSNAVLLKKTWGNLANSHNFAYSEEELNAVIEYLK